MRPRAPAFGLLLLAVAFAWFVALLLGFGVERNVPVFLLASAGALGAAIGLSAPAEHRMRALAPVGLLAAAAAFVALLAGRSGLRLSLSFAAEALVAGGLALAAWRARSWARAEGPRAGADAMRPGLALAALGAALFLPVNLADAPPFVAPGLVGLAGLAIAAATVRADPR